MKNPWKTHRSTLIYENPWITVVENQVTNPKGGNGIYGKVHFKNVAVGIIPIDHDGNTWLVGQYRYTLDTYSWEIPMGGGKLDLPPLESAKRELQEETGLTSNVWNEIARLHTSNSVTDELGIIFTARDLKQGPTEFDETEDLSIRKLPLVEAIEMAKSGEITDAISLIGLLKLAIQ